MDRLSQMHKLEFFNLEASIPPTWLPWQSFPALSNVSCGMRGRVGQNVLNGNELHAEQVFLETLYIPPTLATTSL